MLLFVLSSLFSEKGY